MATIDSSSTMRIRASAMRGLVDRERDRELRAAVVMDFVRPFDLLHQSADQLQTERALRLARVVAGQADAVVANRHLAHRIESSKRDYDFAVAIIGTRMLQGIRQDFVDDEAARHGGVDAQEDLLTFNTELDCFWIDRVRLEKKVGERGDVFGEVDAREIRRLIKLLVLERHRTNAILRAGENL